MRLIVLTVFTLIAFASNSILTRAAVDAGHADPASFAVLRVFAGAVVLLLIASLRTAKLPLLHRDRWVGAGALTVYLIGFSLAYLTLDAGLGALILFGVVQLTIIAATALSKTGITARQIIGGAVAFAGLILALWPQGDAMVDPIGALLMALAGIAWGVYTLAGRGAGDALAVPTANFIWAVPVCAILLLGQFSQMSVTGAGLALVCGGITSGLGYALWYTVLPKLQGMTAGLLQLSVPVIAMIAGALLLAEPIGPTLIIATILVLAGIAYGLTGKQT